MTEKKKIGEWLIEQGSIDKYQLKAALNRQERWGKRLGETLIEMGFITDDVLLKTLGKIFNIPSIKPEKFEISKAVLALIPKEICERLSVIPLAIKTINGKKRFIVAMGDPSDYAAIDEIQFLTNLKVLPMVTTISSTKIALSKYYGVEREAVEDRSEISMVSKVSKPGEHMEIIRQGREDKVKIESSIQNVEEHGIPLEPDQNGKPAPSTDFQKALEDKLKNFEIEESSPKPAPFADEEYEESTGVFKEDNAFNKLLKILKNRTILSDDELKFLLGVNAKTGIKGLKGSKGFKFLIELLSQKKLISEKEKKLLEEE